MSLSFDLTQIQQIQNINLSTAIQQFQTFNMEMGLSSDQVEQLKGTIKSLKTGSMDALSGSIQSTKGLFQTLGLELGQTPKRLLKVADKASKLMGSLQKLGETQFGKPLGDSMKHFSQVFHRETASVRNEVASTFSGMGKTVASTFSGMRSENRSLDDSIRQSEEVMRAKKSGVRDLGQQTKKLTNQTEGTNQATRVLTKTNKEAAKSSNETSLALQNQANQNQVVAKSSTDATNSTRGFKAMLGKAKGAIGLKKIALAAKGVALSAVGIGIFAVALGAVVEGIGWVVGAIGNWIGSLFGASEAQRNAREENERTAEGIEKLNEQIEANRQAHEGNIREIEVSTRANESLIERLQNLKSSEEDNDQVRAKKIATIRELNESIDGLNLVYDEETGLLDEASQLIFDQLGLRNEIAGANATAEEYQRRLNEALREEADIELQLEDLAKQRKEHNRLYREGVKDSRAYNEAIRGLDENYEELSKTLKGVQKDIIDLNVSWEGAIKNKTNLTDQYVTKQILSFENLSQAQQDVVNELGRTFDRHVDQIRGSNGRIEKNNNASAKNWRETMEHNQRVMEGWANYVEKLSEDISDEMLDHIRALGPEYAHKVRELVGMCEYELAEMEEVFKRSCQVAAHAGLAGLDDAQIPKGAAQLIFQSERSMNDAIRDANFANLGLNLAEGLREGIQDGEIIVGTGAAALIREAEKEARKAADSNSPSQVFADIGKDLVAGLVQGIERLQERPTTKLQRLAQAMKRVYNNVNREYTTIGRDMMTGLNQGLLNGEGQVMSTAQRIANNVTRTMREALEINSPSRIMREEVGRQIPAGVAAGIDKYADVALDSAYDLGQDLIDVKLNLPSVEAMIGMGSSRRLAGVTNNSHTYDNKVINHNAGLFEGATIHWHGEEDIRRTMEKIAWVTETEKMRMW